MADRPIIDAAILASPGVSRREEAGDLTPDDFVALVHLAIHNVHMAVAGGVARPKFDEETVAGTVFVRRHRRRRGIRAAVDLAYHLSMRRQAVQTRGSQAHAEQ